MKIKTKLDLYVLKEYSIATLCEKNKNVGEGLSKVVNQNSKSILGVSTFSMKGCLPSLAHRTDKCIDFGL